MAERPVSRLSALTRRQALRYTAIAAGAAAAGGLVSVPASAAPRNNDPVITVNFQINWQQAWNDEAIRLCQQYTDENFNATHKGVRAIPQPWGNASGVLAQVLAGDSSAPAVVSSCCGDFPIALPMLERLDPWLQQDNLPRSLWSQGQLLTYQEPSGLYGVPAYTACQPLIYNQTLFDDLGLKYPDPEWDYTEAEAIWRSLAGKLPNGSWRYASTIELQPSGFDAWPFMFHGWGQADGQMDPTHTKALFSTPQALACGQWWYPLVWDKVFINRFNGFGNGYDGAAAMAHGLVGMYQSAGNMLFEAVVNLRNVKWDVIPMPHWPAGRATNVQVDYYGMNANYPNKDLAWELWKFVAASQGTNRFLVSTTLSFPNLMSMWPEWEAIVNAAAPATRGKQLKWWGDAAIKGYGYGQQFWRYEDSQAEGIIGNIATQIWNKQMDVVEGFNQITKQIDAFEAVGAQTQAKLNTEEAAIAKVLSSVSVGPHTNYPAPSVTGAGVPPTDAKNLVVVGPGGSYTLLGDGWDMYEASDNAVFACLPVTATEGEWSCRVTSVTNLTCPHLSQWAKIGIGAFGDLSDDSPAAYPHVTGAHEIEWQYRIVPGLTPAGASGLLPNGVKNLMAPNTKPAANYLLAPLWLKISRQGDQWTPWASMDGKTWTQLNPPATVRMAGCWVGIYACAHNGSFSNKGYIRATFDNLSFTPTHFVQLGHTGTPPLAGPVPSNWATMKPAGL